MSDKNITRREFNTGATAATATGVLAGTAGQVLSQTSPPFDLVIVNGRVMDPETGFDQVANVGVKNGRIVAITSDGISGAELIDAAGHVVAPGFIDGHIHGITPMGVKLQLRDGVTTQMDLEYGALGTRIDEWYARREGQWQCNYGTTVSHEIARMHVFDGVEAIDVTEAQTPRGQSQKWSVHKSSLEEGNRILETLDEGLRAGALGVGSTLGYMRDGVTAREMFEVQKTAARYDRLSSVHLRLTPGSATGETNSAQEIIANAMLLGAPAILCHFNNPGWELIHELMVTARARGANIWGEIYPFAAGSTTLNAVFLQPETWVEQLGNRYEDTIMDPRTNEFFTLETYRKAIADDPSQIVVVFKMPEETIPDWLRLPGVVIGSDGMVPFEPWDTPYDQLANQHPRTSGGHALALRVGREKGIPLMQSLSQLSYLSAKYLGDAGLTSMQERGRMQQGKVADITIFNPETVTDNATYEKGTLPSSGIPYVLVNGQVVVRDSEVLRDVNPGQPIRYKPEATGRHEALVVENWREAFLPVDFGGIGGTAAHSICCNFTY